MLEHRRQTDDARSVRADGAGEKLEIVGLDVTTVAVPLDGRLRHSDGADPELQIRHIIELHTNEGITGLGEAGPRVRAEQFAAVRDRLKGVDPYNLEAVRSRLQSDKFYRMDLSSLAAAVQTACLDIQGKHCGRRVCDLLGGCQREEIPMIAYVFRKDTFGSHPAALTNDQVLDHVESLVETHGFETIKLKAGAASPEDDIDAILRLRERYPHHRLRIDPNGAWSVATTMRHRAALIEASLEWLEDPVLGIEAMSEIARQLPVPLATNMCCIQPRDFPATIAARAIHVMLLDVWFLGGPWSARQMAFMCRTFGIGVGIHTGGGSCELGIGMAAELHLAASLPTLVHAADAMYHHLSDDVIAGGPLRYAGGRLKVPSGPGLGVTLDPERVERYAAAYREATVAEPTLFPAYPQY